MSFTEEIKARVPAILKNGIDAIAAERHENPAVILREAVREYLDRKGRKVTGVKPETATN